MLSKFMENRHPERGLTLVEVLMVSAILGIVMLAVMSLFIPAVKSTAIQSQVTDVQGNLRLGMNRMTQDLLTAGFLTGTTAPIVFETGIMDDPVDFTIQTVAVSSGFGRVTSASSPTVTFSQPSMVNSFPNGSIVRLFEPVSATELVPGDVYTVSNADSTAGTIDISGFPGGGVPRETVVIRIKDAAQPVLQTIRYQLQDTDADGAPDALVRIVNGATQFLARNVADITFGYEHSGSGRVSMVEVSLQGQTGDFGDDAVSEQKTRELKTSVSLRNTF